MNHYVTCRGCRNSVDAAFPNCPDCGTAIPEFDPEDFKLDEGEGKTIEEVRATECTPEQHHRSALEHADMMERGEIDDGDAFCCFCGTLLVRNREAAI